MLGIAYLLSEFCSRKKQSGSLVETLLLDCPRSWVERWLLHTCGCLLAFIARHNRFAKCTVGIPLRKKRIICTPFAERVLFVVFQHQTHYSNTFTVYHLWTGYFLHGLKVKTRCGKLNIDEFRKVRIYSKPK